MSEPIKLVPSRTDQEIASYLREHVVRTIRPVMNVLDEGSRLGFTITINIEPDSNGLIVLRNINIAKVFI